MSFELENLEELKALSIDVTMESFNFEGAIEVLRSKVNALTDKLKEIVNSSKVQDVENIVKVDKRLSIRKFTKDNYVEVSNRLVHQPKGLNVTFIKYINTLTEVHDNLISKLLVETLNPLEKYLGTLLTIPDEINSKREPKELSKLIKHDVEVEASRVAACFGKEALERRPYRDLIERNSDWIVISDKFNALRDKTLQVNRLTVLELTDLILEHLDNLESTMDKQKVSRVTLHSLSKLVYSAAAEVEFYAVHTYNVEGLGNLLNKIIEA